MPGEEEPNGAEREKLNDLQKLQQIEQSLTMMAENFPSYWRRLYDNCMTQGFKADQAFQILLVQINASNGGSLRT